MPNLLSTTELRRPDIEQLFEAADALSEAEPHPIDTSQQGGLLFFEASTRTRLGFETAAWQLGVKTIALYETKLTDAMSAAESISDTVRTLNPLVTFFGVRHADPNIFEQITPFTNHPVINCGSGDAQHPTQALIDSFAMTHKFGGLDGLNITMTGALSHSRAARSLFELLSQFNGITVTSFTEPQLQFNDAEIARFTQDGKNRYIFTDDMKWGGEQVVYSAGFPPKNASGTFDQETRDRYRITADVVDKLQRDAIILNPLPRIDEIDTVVDTVSQAYYFKQNELALPMRKAVLARYCLQS